MDGEISMIQVVVDLFNEIMCTDCAEEEAMAKRLAAAAAHQPSPGLKRKRRPSTLSRRKFLSDAKERAKSPSTTTAPPSLHLQVPERHAPPQVEQQRQEPEGEINYISADDILRGSGGAETEAATQLPLQANGMYDAVPHAPHETTAPPKPRPEQTPTAVLAYDLLSDALGRSDDSVDEKGNEEQQVEAGEEEEEAKDTRARAESESGLRPASSLLRGVQEYRIDVSPQGEQERSYDDVTDAFSAPDSPPPSVFSSSSSSTVTPLPPRPIAAYNFEPSDDPAAEAKPSPSPSSSSTSSSPPTAARDVYNVAVGGYNTGGATTSPGPVSRRTGLGIGAASPNPTVTTATATPTSTTTTAGASAAPPGEQRESKFWDEAWKQAFEDKFSLGLDSVEKSKGRYSLGHPQCLANEVRAHGPLSFFRSFFL